MSVIQQCRLLMNNITSHDLDRVDPQGDKCTFDKSLNHINQNVNFGTYAQIYCDTLQSYTLVQY